MSYIDPAFAHLDDQGLAIAYTHWLYSDPNGNPATWDKPDLWRGTGHVQFVKRTINSIIGAAGTDDEQTLQIWGGRNAVVFSRQATVKTTVPPGTPANLPFELPNYVTFKQENADGQFNVDETPVSNVFGIVPGQPYTVDPPEMWWGNSEKKYTVGNDTGVAMTADLTWT